MSWAAPPKPSATHGIPTRRSGPAPWLRRGYNCNRGRNKCAPYSLEDQGVVRVTGSVPWLSDCGSRLLKRFAMLAQVEAIHLALLAHPQRHDKFDGLKYDERRKSRPGDGRRNPVKLDQHLAGVAVEQAGISRR